MKLNQKNTLRFLVFLLVCKISLASAQEYFFFSSQKIEEKLEKYSQEEKLAIQKDLDVVRNLCIPRGNEINSSPVYIATAGSPGCRKSTILERFIAQDPRFNRACYIDPDQRTLKFMVHTYYHSSLSAASIANHEDYALARKEAYEKWQDASNYIALTLFEEAVLHKKDIIHGTTSTGDHVPSLLQTLQDADYEIELLVCYANKDFLKKAILYRNQMQKFYQSHPKDELMKAKRFPKKFSSYFSLADKLYLFWSDSLSTPERLAATLEKGKVHIHDEEAYELFQQQYALDREDSDEFLPTWEQILERYTNRF